MQMQSGIDLWQLVCERDSGYPIKVHPHYEDSMRFPIGIISTKRLTERAGGGGRLLNFIPKFRSDNHNANILSKQIAGLTQCNQPFVLFSGGKDSLAALIYVKEIAEKIKKEIVVIHADTTVSLPCNIRYVKKICRLLKVKLAVVRPKINYFELVERWGLPRFRARWCCHALKIGPVNDYLKKQQGNKIVFDGIRAEESKKRGGIEFMGCNKKLGYFTCHPLLYWTSEEVEMYLEKKGLPINSTYEQGFKRASECWCGVFKNPKEFELLFDHCPSLFNRLLELEAKQKSGFAYIYSGGKGFYLRDLKEKILNGAKT